MNEFDVIQRYFSRQSGRDDVILGVGDDAAILAVPPGYQLLVSTDTLVAGVHFSVTDKPCDIGHKSLAVSLSDMAAMAAEPAWITLSLTLPKIDEAWLDGFSQGVFSLAERYQVQLVGGDMTQGPLTISIQIHGLAKPDTMIRRVGARPGDLICVTGCLGDAGLALHLRRHDGSRHDDVRRRCLDRRLDSPTPRIAEAFKLRGLATSAIDISDGLMADLGHLLTASAVGAKIRADDVPQSPEFRALSKAMEANERLALLLTAGDDYELCFTVPESRWSVLQDRFKDWPVPVSLIGQITAERQVISERRDGTPLDLLNTGYEHFSQGC